MTDLCLSIKFFIPFLNLIDNIINNKQIALAITNENLNSLILCNVSGFKTPSGLYLRKKDWLKNKEHNKRDMPNIMSIVTRSLNPNSLNLAFIKLDA
jgi:hypothetical protein